MRIRSRAEKLPLSWSLIPSLLYSMVINSVFFGARLRGLVSQLLPLLAVWLWENYMLSASVTTTTKKIKSGPHLIRGLREIHQLFRVKQNGARPTASTR